MRAVHENIYASGDNVLSGSSIISESNFEDVGNLLIRIDGDNDDFFDIYCNFTDTCTIKCLSNNACTKLILHCDGTCYVECNETISIDCPSNQSSIYQPTADPTTPEPSDAPTIYPTKIPSMIPSFLPSITTMSPSRIPTLIPTTIPTLNPSEIPTLNTTSYFLTADLNLTHDNDTLSGTMLTTTNFSNVDTSGESPDINDTSVPEMTDVNSPGSGNESSNGVFSETTVIIFVAIGAIVLLLCSAMILLFIYKIKKTKSDNDAKNTHLEVEMKNPNISKLASNSINAFNDDHDNKDKRLIAQGMSDDLQNKDDSDVEDMYNNGDNHTERDRDDDPDHEELYFKEGDGETSDDGHHTTKDGTETITPATTTTTATTATETNIKAAFDSEGMKKYTEEMYEELGSENNLKYDQWYNWTENEVLAWLKSLLLANNLDKKIIVNFLNEFSKKNVNGKELSQLKSNESAMDEFILKFSNENQIYSVWLPIKFAIKQFGGPCDR